MSKGFSVWELKRAVQAFQKMGLDVSGARILPDGTIEILTGKHGNALTAAADPLAEWERKHGKSAA